MRIESVSALEVFDSRGCPTVEAVVCCEGGRPCRAIAPSGASTGRAEAKELRDGGRRLRGKGVRLAVENVRTVIAPALIGRDGDDQQTIDRLMIELDGTPDKSRLGANAILAVSLATAYAAADAAGRSPVEHFSHLWNEHARDLPATNELSLGRQPLFPTPMVNMISGGLHAGGNLDLQDFLIIPCGATSYREAFDWIVEIYWELGRRLNDAGFEGTLVGDEGGYGPRLTSNEQALEFVVAAIEGAGLKPGQDVGLALDVASSHFYRDGGYHLAREGRALRAADMVDLLERWVDRYPILSIEDGLAEEDWDGWKQLTERLGHRVNLVGDDLFATNSRRLQRGIDRGIANSVLIKLNQIGTLTETFQTMRLALSAGYRPVVSARSGETEDVTIADLSLATGAGQLKVGSVARSERLAKYNQLLRWEDSAAGRWPYAGRLPFAELRTPSA